MDFVLENPEKSKEFEDEQSLAHIVIKNLNKFAERVVLVSGITAEELKAKDLLSKSLKVAKALKAAGLKPGDVVSIVCENRFEFAYILFGSILAGVTFAPINVQYSKREFEHALGLSKPKIVFTSSFASDTVVKVAKSLRFIQKIVLIDDKNPYQDQVVLLNDFVSSPAARNVTYSPSAADKSRSVSIILCSSGTTGLPKGVQLSQSNMVVVTRFVQNTILRMVKVEEKIMLGLIPWFHAFGLTTLVGAITSCMGKIVLLPKFEEGLFLSASENYKVNIMFLVPPLMVFLAKHPMVDGYDLSSLNTIICGAAPLSKELEQAVYDRLKNRNLTIRQGYGMSELSLSVLLQKGQQKPGSVGDLNEGSLAKVIDKNGKSLGPNKRGELCFKGNQIMMGYIGDAKATNETIDKDGWLHTGDVGYYDEERQFYIVDRIKELIKVKGFQVPPAEIEGLLLTHRGIKDAAVIGIPDEASGELPLAFVVKQTGFNLTEKEVIDFVAKNASKPKWLRGGVKFVQEIPKNPSGKILRRELRLLIKNSNLKSKL